MRVDKGEYKGMKRRCVLRTIKDARRSIVCTHELRGRVQIQDEPNEDCLKRQANESIRLVRAHQIESKNDLINLPAEKHPGA